MVDLTLFVGFCDLAFSFLNMKLAVSIWHIFYVYK